ncbi:alpha/beta fold hydrolase [Leifsonia sp. YAF41]|uniref:alpha/beta fold hydrolase n=1 Tax=Leifsonia sp. YAF41 TaxID=3233086 RepID=UPI003F9D35AC
MKKPLRIALTTVGSLAAIVALALAATSIINVVATNAEAENLEPYGQFVPVDGKKMNVMISGQGDETIVLLPGFGTGSPSLDFSPLIMELESSYRVVVIEPFGYGLSDPTEKERTTQNIGNEVHKALQALDIDKYILMGHSIAGIYALDYTTTYRDEVTAFVGIDSSVPGQPDVDMGLSIDALKAAKSLGLLRLLLSTSGDIYADSPHSEKAKEQMRILTFKNSFSSTYLNEMGQMNSNFAAARGTTFPKDLPVLLFAKAETPGVPNWVELHEEQAASVDRGKAIILEGLHHLHHTLSKEIAEDTRRFLAEVTPASAQ